MTTEQTAGERVGLDLPGVPLASGFEGSWRHVSDTLTPEARQRVRATVAAVQEARRKALAASHSAVIGGGCGYGR